MKLKHLSLLTFIIALLMLVTINVKADGFNVTRNITGLGLGVKVTNTFTYSVTASGSNPATVTPPANTTIAFSAVSPNSSGVASKSASPLISEATWTGLNYTKPGTYNFVVSESASSNATLYPKDTNTYTVTIFVANNLNANNEPDGTFTKTYIGSKLNGTGSKIAKTGTATFTSSGAGSSGGGSGTGGRHMIGITKRVTGNTADRTLCFTMTVNFTAGLISGETYHVTGSSCTNTDFTASAATGSKTVQVKHGETVYIGKDSNGRAELPSGATYTVTETAVTNYTVYVDGSSSASSTRQTSSKTVGSNNSTTFRNDKQETTPTGIIIRTLPFLILIALSVIGVVAILKTKKLEEDIQ